MPRELTEKEKAAFAANPAFENAAERESKQLLEKPADDELLDLYGLYKTGCDEDITEYQKGHKNAKAKKVPGMFDFKGKAKLRAWEAVVNDGVNAEEAQKRYIATVEELKEKYGFDAAKEPEVVGSS
ncbi:acyl CoA binding protein-domain-containing protein [Xylaria palmicola]|nr:acyl CoA binding protein-domain-containing protein [Xylaria palmicola]